MNNLNLIESPNDVSFLAGSILSLIIGVAASFVILFVDFYSKKKELTAKQYVYDLENQVSKMAVFSLFFVLISAIVACIVIFGNSRNLTTVNDNKNVNAIQNWGEENYGIELNNKMATQLLELENSPVYSISLDHEQTKDLHELGSSLIRDKNNRIVQVNLIWVGTQYKLLEDTGNELERV